MLKTKGLLLRFSQRLFLLMLSLGLCAFIDSDFFRRNFDFQRLLYQYETLGPSTTYQNKIGIEIEGYYTEKRTTDGSVSLTSYKDLIDLSQITLLAQGFQSLGYKDQSQQEHKDGASGLFFINPNQINASKKRLLFVSDDSIFHPHGTRPVEIVSPVLESLADVEAFFSVVRATVADHSFTSEPLNSGTHFHFDFNTPQREEILILTIVIEKLLPEIKAAFSVQDSRSTAYASEYSAADFESLVGFTKSAASLSKSSKLHVHRHRATNWRALEKHGTFEFRLFNSTSDPRLLSIQSDLIGQIVKAVRLRDPTLLNLLKSENLTEVTLDSVAHALNCLYADQKNKSYAKTQSTAEVNNSRAIADKLTAQKPNINLRTLPTTNFLNFPLGNSMASQYGRSSARLTYSYTANSRVAPSCIEFYK